MAITNNPTIWAARIQQALEKSFVYGAAFTNRDWEGEIRDKGDTVKILNVTVPDVDDYTGTVTWGELTDGVAATLTIDQAKYFAFALDDVDDQKSGIALIESGTTETSKKISDARDQYVASFHASVSDTTPDNTYGDSTTPIVVGFGTGEVKPYDAFLELQQRLDDANVPRPDRRTVIPPWFLRGVTRQLGTRATGLGDDVTANGFAGKLDGVMIYISPNVPATAGAKYKVLMGPPYITWADAIVKVETMRLQNAFATGVRGLNLYGATLTRPEGMALGTFDKGDLTA